MDDFTDKEKELINYTLELIGEDLYSDRGIEEKILDKIDRLLED